MKLKSFLATGALLLSLAAIGSAKSWDIFVDSNTKVGNVTLPAGTYTVKLTNNQAEFFTDYGKKFTVPVKVANGSTKYDETAVKTEKQGDANVMHAIDLSGNSEELKFGE